MQWLVRNVLYKATGINQNSFYQINSKAPRLQDLSAKDLITLIEVGDIKHYESLHFVLKLERNCLLLALILINFSG